VIPIVHALMEKGMAIGTVLAFMMAVTALSLPEAIILVPGFGAQGGTAADVMAAFRPDGLGAVVNSSRGVPVSTSQPSLVTATPSPSTM
jgi:orotidine-5'-phosphate decarboxylase